MNRTYSAKPADIERKWHIVDATGIPVGRIAAQVSMMLRGKHKPLFTYNQDCGDFVIIINCDRAVLTGNKQDELIYWHTGWPGGLKNVSRGTMLAENSDKLVAKAVWGMMPKTKLGKAMFKKLKVFRGSEHTHAAQQPTELKVTK
ncbi:MAG: 50S ribosomal protein L13 [Armatimonadetes bacterium]|nr:50S ribosomal protein L13 [Armatimonadota bacterium]